MNRDVVAIGASAGGVEVLLDLARELPANLEAAVFVVLHTSAHHSSHLPELLSKRGPLPARHPIHGEQIQRGTIYVAPPDNHLQVVDGSIEVVRGPKDNGHRPAVDVLFRTASAAYGPRVIGVVLTGYLDCGTAGMLSIKARGGIGVVQHPDTASAPDMPRSVIQRVKVDHVVHPLELPGLLTKLVGQPAGPASDPDTVIKQLEGSVAGVPASIVCPLCEGALTEAQPGVFTHFRCHVGHTFSLDSLLREQGEHMERVLWAAVRALEESASLAMRASRNQEAARHFAECAALYTQQAAYLKQVLLRAPALAPLDSPIA